MADNSHSVPSLIRIVEMGLARGADSDRIIRVAEQLTDSSGWSPARRRQFRNQVAALIARQRRRR